MNFIQDKGIRTAQWLSNEMLRSDDINFINEYAYTNFTNAMAALAHERKAADDIAYVIGGLLLEWNNLLTSDLRSGIVVSTEGYYLLDATWGFVDSAGDVFVVTVPATQVVAVDAGGAQDRIDVLEVRPVRNQYDSESRQYKDPITGDISSSLTNTKVEYSYEFQIKKGTEAGSPVALAKTVGWIKLAEIYVASSASAIDQDDIKDVRDSGLWTTEASSTIMRVTNEIAGDCQFQSAQTRIYAVSLVGFSKDATNVQPIGSNVYITVSATGNDYAFLPVNLPDGAIVTKLWGYILSDGTLATTVDLIREELNNFGSGESMAQLSTISGTEVLLEDTSITGGTIDNSTYKYFCAVNPPATPSQTCRVFSVVIEYTIIEPKP